jgi:hypothetical protein
MEDKKKVGAPRKEPTRVLSERVPVAIFDAAKELVKAFVKSYKDTRQLPRPE